MIDPGGIPQIDADLDAVSAAGARLRTEGGAVRDTGADVHATWQGLSAVYEAPETGHLLAATAPVRTAADQVGSRLERVGAALVAYAEEVRPIQAELVRLRGSAAAFVAAADADDDWRKDAGKVEEHSGLLSAVASAKAAWEEAERRCASAINAVDGGVQFVADNGDGVTQLGEYGHDAQTWQAAATSEEGAGWGTPEERDRPWYEDIGHGAVSFGKGVVIDGAWGTVKALGTMVNPWADDFGASWKGLGMLGLALVPGALVVNSQMSLFGLEQGALQNTLVQAGKGLVAWDMWGEDPARAAGAVGFNVLATLGTGGAGAALTGTGRAATVTRTAAQASRAAVARGVAHLPRLDGVKIAISQVSVRFAHPYNAADDLFSPGQVDTRSRVSLAVAPDGRTAPSGSTGDLTADGAARRPRQLFDQPVQDAWARQAYDDFLAGDRDVDAIADHMRNTRRPDGREGYTADEIASIKQHVFRDEHRMEDYETGSIVTRRFDPNPDMAGVWIRLRSGRALPEDAVLLEHELAELSYMRQHPGSTYGEAHAHADTLHDWDSNSTKGIREDFEEEW